mmetsp:Transcript_87/g.197  ORF Transcript_87/g.197 Transcript_87/m.197 type:complete len:95 (+) Transcript_87:1367-1651(+)
MKLPKWPAFKVMIRGDLPFERYVVKAFEKSSLLVISESIFGVEYTAKKQEKITRASIITYNRSFPFFLFFRREYLCSGWDKDDNDDMDAVSFDT